MLKRLYGLFIAALFTLNTLTGAAGTECVTSNAKGGTASMSTAMEGMAMPSTDADADNASKPVPAPCSPEKVPVSCAAASGCIQTPAVFTATDVVSPAFPAPLTVMPTLPQLASRVVAPEPPPPRA